MDDDFGTPGALAALFGLVTTINRARDAGVTAAALTVAQTTLMDLAAVLGFQLTAAGPFMARPTWLPRPSSSCSSPCATRPRGQGLGRVPDRVRDGCRPWAWCWRTGLAGRAGARVTDGRLNHGGPSPI